MAFSPDDWRFRHAPARAPFDAGRGGNPCPTGGSGSEAQPSLGNLRNTYAGTMLAHVVTTSKDKEKGVSEAPTKSARRAERMDLQRVAAGLTPDMRVAHCLWTPTSKTVELVKRGPDARFTGVQTCGSVWSCPCCSARISEVRRGELRQLEEWAGSQKLRLVMMTLTARHRGRALGDMVDRLALAKRRLQNRKGWQRLRGEELVGTVSVREATHGDTHGWHPHYHVLCLVQAGSDDEAIALLEPLRLAWLDCLRKEALTGTADRAFHLQTGDAVSAYISKHGRDEGDRKAAAEARPAWGIAEEMTLARTKRGRAGGRSPWQILRDAAAGDDSSSRLWQEYARTMQGRRQQVWSDGLKQACGLLEVDDEQAAEGEEFMEEQDETLATWPKAIWNRLRHRRGEILAAAETGGAEAVADLTARTLRGETQADEEALIEECFDSTEAEEVAQARWVADTAEFVEVVRNHQTRQETKADMWLWMEMQENSMNPVKFVAAQMAAVTHHEGRVVAALEQGAFDVSGLSAADVAELVRLAVIRRSATGYELVQETREYVQSVLGGSSPELS